MGRGEGSSVHHCCQLRPEALGLLGNAGKNLDALSESFDNGFTAHQAGLVVWAATPRLPSSGTGMLAHLPQGQPRRAFTVHWCGAFALTQPACPVSVPVPVALCSTASSVTVRSTIRRLREQVEA